MSSNKVHVVYTKIHKIDYDNDTNVVFCRKCFFKDPDYEYCRYLLDRTHEVESEEKVLNNTENYCHQCKNAAFFIIRAADDCKMCECEDWLSNQWLDHPKRRPSKKRPARSTMKTSDVRRGFVKRTCINFEPY
ncbi:hypothetical protein SlGVgp085 [Spodoptera litura granulovirus]|uniref:Uncharacterized protein n=1 Tax=Spodoptera litura granulovirus TaxID=359919 RepID=A5IZT7_9BBAC|nr:hypothetical protein SlGVgp085 [Spodoptera litura granulovirus]ABQ52028.1 hypothetical protein SlGVgp085 [Spodoptera litura granulovirus]